MHARNPRARPPPDRLHLGDAAGLLEVGTKTLAAPVVGDSAIVVYSALGANLGIAIAKFIAAAVTGQLGHARGGHPFGLGYGKRDPPARRAQESATSADPAPPVRTWEGALLLGSAWALLRGNKRVR